MAGSDHLQFPAFRLGLSGAISWTASRIDLAGLRRSEDSFMDELIGGLADAGFPVVRVNFPAPTST